MLEYNIDLKGKTILVTGAAGFIGSNLVKRLLTDFDNIKVIGIDSITDYYERQSQIRTSDGNKTVCLRIGRSSKAASPTKHSLRTFSPKTK